MRLLTSKCFSLVATVRFDPPENGWYFRVGASDLSYSANIRIGGTQYGACQVSRSDEYKMDSSTGLFELMKHQLIPAVEETLME